MKVAEGGNFGHEFAGQFWRREGRCPGHVTIIDMEVDRVRGRRRQIADLGNTRPLGITEECRASVAGCGQIARRLVPPADLDTASVDSEYLDLG